MIQWLGKQGRVAAVLLAVFSASCGGGGGGGSPPLPPPPGSSTPPTPSPPTPSAVVAKAAASVASVQEGQPFSVDASTSTTTNGSPLSFAWTQVSGPTVAIANANTAKLDLSAAEVTADTTAQFRVTVTAGSASAQATVDVNFANIAQTPVYNNGPQLLATATFTIPVRKVVGDFDFGMAGMANAPGDPLAFIDFVSSSGQLLAVPSQIGTLPSTTVIQMSNLVFPAAFALRQFSLIEEATDQLRILLRSSNGTVTTGATFALSRPCGFSHTTVLSGSGLLIGQRTGFSVVYAGGATPVINRTVTTGQPFCALLAPRSPINGGSFGGIFPAYLDVIALDVDTNVLNVFQFVGPGATGSYQLKQQTPLQLNASKPLKLANWAAIDPTGSMSMPTAMAFVFTDGVHNGEHRLVIVGFDASKNLVQETRNLGLGVPVEVLTDNLDGDLFYPEIVVIKSTSPQAEIYETSGGLGPLVPLGSPSFLEIGLGASSAIRSGLFSLPGITIAFPDKKEVRIIGARP